MFYSFDIKSNIVLPSLRRFYKILCYFIFKSQFVHIFPKWNLGRVLNSRYYFWLFQRLENVIFLEEQTALPKEY